MGLRQTIPAGRNPFASVFVVVTAVLVACQDGGPPRGGGILFHWLSANASATAPDSVTRSGCTLEVSFPGDSLPTTTWTATQLGHARRDVVVINRSAFWRDDSLPQLRVSAQFSASDSVQLVLEGPYADTLRGRRLEDQWGRVSYEGTWTCPVRFPLAADSTLLAHGYDAQLPMVGFWRLQPMLSID